MPELPEVETIVRQLQQSLAGRTIARADLLRPDVIRTGADALRDATPGLRINTVTRRAKRVIIDLTPTGRLIVHLGMSGRLLICTPTAELEPHTHLRITFTNPDRELRFRDPRRFGGIWYFPDGIDEPGTRLGPVGPEPLELTPAAFRRLLARPRQIKALLMDQTAIAGLGNIYCCEAMHIARIHPETRADSLDAPAADRLLRSIKAVLRKAIRFEGSTYMDYRSADGAEGSFQRFHRVYQCEGNPCPECKTPIERLIQSNRSTFLCPRCQPKPRKSRRRA